MKPTLLCVLSVALVCAALGAQERKFELLPKAQELSAKSGKGIFLISFAEVPGDNTNARIQFTAAIKADPDIAKSAAHFELAVVDVFSPEEAGNQYVDPKLAAKYGWPCTVNVLAPTATKQLWQKELSRDNTEGRKEHTKETIAATMKEAADAWQKFFKPIEDIEAKFKTDKAARQNADLHISLADAWGAGFAAGKARVAFDEALRLIRKTEKAGPRIEAVSMRAAESEFFCEAYEAVIKSCDVIAKAGRDSQTAWRARVLSARATAYSGNKEAGKAALEGIIKDKKAAGVLVEAKEALAEVEKLKDEKKK